MSCYFACARDTLTQVVFVRRLAPSQTDSSTSGWSGHPSACRRRGRRRRWGSATSQGRATGAGRVWASRPSTGRRPPPANRSPDSRARHLEEDELESHSGSSGNKDAFSKWKNSLPDSLSTVTTRPLPLDTRWAIPGRKTHTEIHTFIHYVMI